jgi:WD40 repeat protein
VVTASGDKTAQIWDAETGREIVSLKKGHESGVYHAAFSPDGKRVVTASYDNTARIWPVDLLPIAENRRPRDLTPEERDRFEIEPPSHPSER